MYMARAMRDDESLLKAEVPEELRQVPCYRSCIVGITRGERFVEHHHRPSSVAVAPKPIRGSKVHRDACEVAGSP